MRRSKQRDLISDILTHRCDHPTAEMIYLSAREKNPNISLGTIYRDLKNLANAGLISTLETEDDKVHFDGNVTPHSHFICSDCHGITDIFEDPAVPAVLGDKNFSVRASKCVYYGQCPTCYQKAEDNRSDT